MNALTATPIFRGRNFYVPRFELFIGDSPARADLLHDVMQVSYTDSIESIDTFSLTINNWDADRLTFKHHDSHRLDPNQRVRLHMGYLDDAQGLRLMMQGVITEMAPTFPASGQPTLTVSGRNVLHTFCKRPVSRSYDQRIATASGVATKLCQELNVAFRNDTSHRANEVKHDHLIQDNRYDILFLLSMAHSEGYDVVVEEPKGQGRTTLRFDRPSDGVRAAYELRYGATLNEFHPVLSTAKQVSSVAVSGWDTAKGEPIHVEVGQQALGASAGLKSKLLRGAENPVGDRSESITNRPIRDQQAARALATATLSAINQELVTGTGTVVGLPELRAGAQVYLWGLGQRFSGRYFVTGTTHTLGMSGYTTQFHCRLEELMRDPHERS